MKLGLSKTDYPFDYFFEKATSERAAVKNCCTNCDDDDDDVNDGEMSSDSDDELTTVSEPVNRSDNTCPVSVDTVVTQ